MSSHYIFFSGKGGVGKTSMACATAVQHALQGRRTLIVTTDPASNLADVFEQPIGHHITPIAAIDNLWAMEIDPDQATEEYKARALDPIRAIFPPQMVAVVEEQMSGPCTSEVAAFDRFTDFLTVDRASQSESFDVIIFDTAPTGHTIRLLELPAEWTRSIELAERGSGQTCIGPTATIQAAKLKYEQALATLRNAQQTEFVFVLQPEAISIRETQRAITELQRLGMHNFRLIVNGIIPPAALETPLFAARAKMQQHYLATIASALPYPTQRMTLFDGEIKGWQRLKQVAHALADATATAPDLTSIVSVDLLGRNRFTRKGATSQRSWSAPLSAILAQIKPNSHRRTIFFAGKGGVGKTVASCVTAVWLARQGYKTLLLTTDPAAHLGDVLGVAVGDAPRQIAGVDHLWAANIDPKRAADQYKARILDDARRRGRPEGAIQVMAEELDSPCTEEMAAFDRFIDYAVQDGWDAVVFDTAPTGHTLRLLELPVEWSKQIDVKVFASVDASAADDYAKARFGQVIEMMRDPAQSTFAFVLYPETTPIVEAHRAAQELATVGIQPGLIVVNFVIPEEAATTPFVQARRAMQEHYLAEIGERFAAPQLIIPLLPQEVKGLEMLIELGEQLFQPMPELT